MSFDIKKGPPIASSAWCCPPGLLGIGTQIGAAVLVDTIEGSPTTSSVWCCPELLGLAFPCFADLDEVAMSDDIIEGPPTTSSAWCCPMGLLGIGAQIGAAMFVDIVEGPPITSSAWCCPSELLGLAFPVFTDLDEFDIFVECSGLVPCEELALWWRLLGSCDAHGPGIFKFHFLGGKG